MEKTATYLNICTDIDAEILDPPYFLKTDSRILQFKPSRYVISVKHSLFVDTVVLFCV